MQLCTNVWQPQEVGRICRHLLSVEINQSNSGWPWPRDPGTPCFEDTAGALCFEDTGAPYPGTLCSEDTALVHPGAPYPGITSGKMT